MENEKSKVRQAIDNLISGAIIWLHGELEEKPDSQPPLYTKEEKDEMFKIKKDIEKFPKRSDE
jgi:hypothetical protein